MTSAMLGDCASNSHTAHLIEVQERGKWNASVTTIRDAASGISGNEKSAFCKVEWARFSVRIAEAGRPNAIA